MMYARSAVAEFLAMVMFFTLGFWLDGVTGLPGWLAWGLALGMTVLTFGGISGAHVNPAVTLGMTMGGRFPLAAALPYMIAQLLGGITATALLLRLTTGSFALSGAERYLVGPAVGTSVWQTMCLEAGGAFLLALVVCIATDARSHAWATWLLIGGALGLAVWMVGAISGGSINPVRALAPFVAARPGEGLGFTLVAYVAGPLIGGMLAGSFYRVFRDTPVPS